MKTSNSQKIYFLENSPGQIVRSLQWDGDTLNFIFRQDTHRVEAVEDLKALKAQEIPFVLLETVSKSTLVKNSRYELKNLNSPLTLVSAGEEVLPNIELPIDNPEHFKLALKRTAATAAGLILFFIAGSLLVKITTPPTEELQIVQVMDRKEIQRMVVAPSEKKQPMAVKKVNSTRKIVKNKSVPVKRKVQPIQQQGALTLLGQLKNSSQKGGLQLSKVKASPGIGNGGTQGSGGVQTSVYAKGLFAAPVGTGNRADGSGGYGTKGKGGGQAGFGKLSLAGASSSFFEPIESETWVDGGLDRNAIAAVIQRHLSEVRYCYEQGLQQRPQLAGRVSMKFMIGPHGVVMTANVNNSSLQHPVVENCIRSRLMTWKFPRPEGGVNVKVSYPFVLRRVSSL